MISRKNGGLRYRVPPISVQLNSALLVDLVGVRKFIRALKSGNYKNE